MRRTIVSVFQDNIPKQVLLEQSKVVSKYLPSGTDFHQYRVGHHALGLDDFLEKHIYDTYLVLDIDCIPLEPAAVSRMFAGAESGVLIGCAQRANHLHNDEHVYAGPCGLAFSRELFDCLGQPSFRASHRGDVAEEWSYRCEERGLNIELLWPTHVIERRWDLTDGRYFGIGTTYADSFFHAFEISKHRTTVLFIEKCHVILETHDAVPPD